MFGDLYPAGVSGTPYDEDEKCLICGKYDQVSPIGRCTCPPCDECGEIGNPDCVKNHGLLAKELAHQEGENSAKFWRGRLNVMDELTVEATIGYDPPVYAAFNMWRKSIQQVATEILAKHNELTREQDDLCHAQDCMYESPATAWATWF